MIYTESIREKEGGTYGVGVATTAQRSPQKRTILQIQFDTNPEQAEKLCRIASEQLYEFAKNGPTPEQLSMAVENMKKNLPESRINNSYWLNVLDKWNDQGIDYDAEYEAAINEMTSEYIAELLTKMLKQKNFIEFKSMPAGK